MRNRIAMIMLWATWPVCLINRLWNNAPFMSVRWILLDKTVNQDFRWYIVYNELWLSAMLVISAMLIMKRRTKSIALLLWAIFCVSIIDIINYWLWFRRNEMALYFEGITMLLFTILIFKNHAKTI